MRLGILATVLLFLSACGSHTPPAPDVAGSTDAKAAEEQKPAAKELPTFPTADEVLRQTHGFDEDPWEPFNRKIFKFNDTFDEYILEPVARGYNYVLPAPVKTGVANFFDNLWQPLRVLSSLIQLKFQESGEQGGRFIINSTAGIAGLIDIAKRVGLPEQDDDLGSALAYWGVGSGPYLVVPFWGPSDLRDTFTRIADRFANPMYYVGNFWIGAGATGLEAVDLRRQFLDATDAAKKGSLDYYIFQRNSYKQHRLAVIFDGAVSDEAGSTNPNAPSDDPLDDPNLTR